MRLFIGLVLGLSLLTIFWLGPENVMAAGRSVGTSLAASAKAGPESVLLKHCSLGHSDPIPVAEGKRVVWSQSWDVKYVTTWGNKQTTNTQGTTNGTSFVVCTRDQRQAGALMPLVWSNL